MQYEFIPGRPSATGERTYWKKKGLFRVPDPDPISGYGLVEKEYNPISGYKLVEKEYNPTRAVNPERRARKRVCAEFGVSSGRQTVRLRKAIRRGEV